jgi:hypothetical protein
MRFPTALPVDSSPGTFSFQPRIKHTRRTRICAKAAEKVGLLLECDGVVVDTHSEGHRVAFNRAFQV